MQNRNFAFLFLILVGCSAAREPVFVDLSRVPLKNVTIQPIETSRPNSTPVSVAGATLPGEAPKDVENLRGEQKVAIRAEVEKQTKAAIATITERLGGYYQREIDEYLKSEYEKLPPLKSAIDQQYLDKLRPIFEESARKRGPLLTRFIFLTQFPPPDIEKILPVEGDNLSEAEKKRRVEVRELQRQINEIDTAYKNTLVKLDESGLDQLASEAENIKKRGEAKQQEINRRANDEATQLVRRFSSGLSERIFNRYTFRLPGIPTKSVNFPRIDSQSNDPGVPFDKVTKVKETRTEVEKELDAFLGLHSYQRVPSQANGRDVTEEFIAWRTNLKSGHWESWQTSSKPN